MLQFHPDGIVYLEQGNARYEASRADFDADIGADAIPALPVLPAPFVSYVFEPGGRHFVSDGANQRAVPPGFTPGKAQAVLAKFNALLARANARNP